MKYVVSWIIVSLSLGSYRNGAFTAPYEKFSISYHNREIAMQLYDIELKNAGAHRMYFIDSVKIDSL
jgi:hypothetical protein